MWRLMAAALAALLLLVGCAPEPEPVEQSEGESSAPVLPSQPEEPAPEEEEPEDLSVYIPPAEGLSMEGTIEAYFEQQYLSYRTFVDIDLTAILDDSYATTGNMVVWTRMLNQRRRLLAQEDLCYVETQAFPYTIRYLEPEELEDERLEFWNTRSITGGNQQKLIHFVIEGEPGKAYPPIMPTGAQHTMRLVKEEGAWKITLHYFPGSVRKFLREEGLREYTDDEMLAMLREEFGGLEAQPEEPFIPAGAIPYSGEDAAVYALAYGESANPDFYHVGDWMGDCANFNSQCVWAGFRSGNHRRDGLTGMTVDWYAGEGGGSPAWENVERFYQYVTTSPVLRAQEIPGIRHIRQGDMIQTAAGGKLNGDGETGDDDEDRRFGHSLVVVDPDRLVLAQHSPACLVYYADIVNVRTRILRPLYLME